ncbi:MAG: hypothetical protein KDK91_27555, partial [Gammaproteobacteria bacterium]|nr:hypothetical protein [Gammaproteobacteria bacterium]
RLPTVYTRSSTRMASATRSAPGFLALLLWLCFQASAVAQTPLSTAFSYQGFLENDGVPIDGAVDLRFSLWSAQTGGSQIGQTADLPAERLRGGIFSVELDFGLDPFKSGSALWLEVEMAFPAGTGSYRTLSPRRGLTATPFALHALTSGPSDSPISGQLCPVGQTVVGVNADNTLVCADLSKTACAGVSCLPHQRCEVITGRTGMDTAICVDTCDGFRCDVGEQCALEPVSCIAEPCPPVAICRPEMPDPSDPCSGMSCPDGQACQAYDNNGQQRAYCADTCDGRRCASGEICELQPVNCISAPCPPVAACVPREVSVDPCARLDCGASQECRVHKQADGRQTGYCADTCSNLTCPLGEHCELVDVLCVAAPCPPLAQCVPDAQPRVCDQPIEPGPCRAAIPRWGFDAEDGRCERFVYGGCGGNQNNFTTRAECAQTCGGQVDACTLPAETGPCKAHLPRWYHNEQSGRCERFIYGGCAGNDNNFATLAACEAACRPEPVGQCEQPADQGPCLAAIPRWFHNVESGQCERFIYGGCGGNTNNFSTRTECEQSCQVDVNTCELAPEPGPCKGVLPSWFHNPATGQCERFNYSGCGGNENRFATRAACERACDVSVDVCQQPRDAGPCRAAMPRWFHNAQNGQCERFIYGGCGGNDNNFDTQRACQSACDVQTNVCDLPADVGPCDAAILRWAHDPASGQCERFVYGGCGGNANNFTTLADCESACEVEPGNVCDLPAEVGPCQAAIPRWYHDSASGSCESFIYGGCGGNANNFTSAEACRMACPTGRSLSN